MGTYKLSYKEMKEKEFKTLSDFVRETILGNTVIYEIDAKKVKEFIKKCEEASFSREKGERKILFLDDLKDLAGGKLQALTR